MGTGSPAALRLGTDSRLVRSTTLPSLSKASSRAGIMVDPQNETVTEETGFGKVVRTGIGSVAMADAIPLWPLERGVKKISMPFPLVCWGSWASVNTTPFSSHRGTRLALPSASKGTAFFKVHDD